MRQYIKHFIQRQLQDMKAVYPTSKWDGKKFILNSPAGIIEFKPKKPLDAERFRNIWINRFEALKDSKDRNDLFYLYKEIRKNEKVTFRANLNTRWKGFISVF